MIICWWLAWDMWMLSSWEIQSSELMGKSSIRRLFGNPPMWIGRASFFSASIISVCLALSVVWSFWQKIGRNIRNWSSPEEAAEAKSRLNAHRRKRRERHVMKNRLFCPFAFVLYRDIISLAKVPISIDNYHRFQHFRQEHRITSHCSHYQHKCKSWLSFGRCCGGE